MYMYTVHVYVYTALIKIHVYMYTALIKVHVHVVHVSLISCTRRLESEEILLPVNTVHVHVYMYAV